MPKLPDFYVLHNNISGDLYIVNGLRKCESIKKHLNKLCAIMEKQEKFTQYILEDFFSKCEFDKSKIQLGWNHSTNELMLWHKKIFSIRSRIK